VESIVTVATEAMVLMVESVVMGGVGGGDRGIGASCRATSDGVFDGDGVAEGGRILQWHKSIDVRRSSGHCSRRHYWRWTAVMMVLRAVAMDYGLGTLP